MYLGKSGLATVDVIKVPSLPTTICRTIESLSKQYSKEKLEHLQYFLKLLTGISFYPGKV